MISTRTLTHAVTGASAVIAALALAAAAHALYQHTSLPARRRRASMSVDERAEYDVLIAEIVRAHRDLASHREQARAEYIAALFPGAPQRLEDFDIAGLATALNHAHAQRAHALAVMNGQFGGTSATTWDLQIDALTIEIGRRRDQNPTFTRRRNVLDRARLTHALIRHQHAAPAVFSSPPPPLAYLPEGIVADLAGIVLWGLNTERDDYEHNPYPEHLYRTLHRARRWLVDNARVDTGDLANLRALDDEPPF